MTLKSGERINSPVVGAILLILVTTIAPVTLVASCAAGITTTITTRMLLAAAAATRARALQLLLVVGLKELFLAVFLLALDKETVAVPGGLVLALQELLLLLLRSEFDKDTALEAPVAATAQANGVDGTVGSKQLLDVELSGGLLKAKALGVNGAGHGRVLENLGNLVTSLGGNSLGQRNLTLHSGVVVDQLNSLGGLKSLNDGGERLEAAHATEGVEEVQRNGIVGAATDLGEKEFVHREVRVRQVEFNLSGSKSSH